MRYLKRIMVYTLAVSLVLSQVSFVATAVPAAGKADKMMMVRSFGNADFPSSTNLNSSALSDEIEEMVAFANSNGFDSILFEARPAGDALYKSEHYPNSQYLVKEQGDFTFFDPLKELTKQANEKNLDVYVSVNPYYLGEESNIGADHWAKENPETVFTTEAGLYALPSSEKVAKYNTDDIVDISKEYDIEGIVITGVNESALRETENFPEHLSSLISDIESKMASDVKLGVSLDPTLVSESNLLLITEKTDILFANIPLAGYANTLSILQKSNNEVISILDINNSTDVSSSLTTKVIEGSSQGATQYLYDSYQMLKQNKNLQASLLFSLSKSNVSFPKYNPAQSLSITRPTDTLRWQYDTYYITGTSNPSQTLSVNGSGVERFTNDGIFGVLVNLKMGSNTFSFQNGATTETVTINRVGPPPAQTTTKVTSAYPVTSAITTNHDVLAVKCVAPAGAVVFASLAGQQIQLTQNVAASPGIPATFSGSFTLSGAGSDEVKNLGAITYTLQYNGSNVAYPSVGSVFLMGENARPFIEVQEYTATVYKDKTVTEGAFKSIYKRGTQEEIVSQLGEYYELASGGYMRKNHVKVLTGSGYDPTKISSITAAHDDQSERFILKNADSIPYTIDFRENNDIVVTLHGDLTLPSNIDTTSTLMSSITWAQNDKDLVVTVKPKNPENVWGADILYDGKDAVLYFKKAPTLSNSIATPLAGVSIVLDAGHGGYDSGALGILGIDGPMEKELNLVNSIILQQRLEKLGATVTMTRTTNEQDISLYERVEVAQNTLPDLFISLHHNSVGMTINAERAKGVEVYYYEGLSFPIAKSVLTSLSTSTQRAERRVAYNYFVVNRMSHTPSILTEIGFLSNTVEYKNSCDPVEIYKTADAIATAVVKTIYQSGGR